MDTYYSALHINYTDIQIFPRRLLELPRPGSSGARSAQSVILFIRAYLEIYNHIHLCAWWRHQMEAFSVLFAIYAGNSTVPGEFSAQRPVTQSFDVFFDLRLNKRLSKQSWSWWLETLSHPLWRHCNGLLLPNQNHPTSEYRWSTPNNLLLDWMQIQYLLTNYIAKTVLLLSGYSLYGK